MVGIALIGPMGAGKTTAGSLLAKQLSWPFFDLDKLIVEAQARSIADIFADDGEPHFRKLETEMMKTWTERQMVEPHPCVLATGGGAITSTIIRDILRASWYTVYLRASVDTLVERLRYDTSRPLLNGEEVSLRQRISQLYEVRSPLYEDCSDLTVNVTGDASRSIVARISAEVRSHHAFSTWFGLDMNRG